MARYHVVAKGDCLSSIAFQNGYYPGTIWEHPNNDALRDLRGDPNVLFEGDQVFLPDKEPKTTACQTGKRHRFTKRGVPARFRLQILNADKPRPNLDYKITIDGKIEIEGTTDGEGTLDIPIPPDARRGVLLLKEDGARYNLRFGGLSPMMADSGVRERLASLGYLRSLDAPEEDMPAAIAMFQRKNGLTATGVLDDATSEKIQNAHDKKT
ncbi:MAG: peptidoglycan-binding domain-containing protein [Polyangiaceae bacterium]